MPRKRAPLGLSSESSYLLIGGFGGIGRALATAMVERGARNLIFMSRSGAASEKAKETLAELERLGTTVMVANCDISDEQQLVEALSDISAKMPPIKGVVNLAWYMVVSLFTKVTGETWLKALRPKVHGTWNLHNHLPRDMEFFVLMSSIAGAYGSLGQGSYSASSTFLDAFASYRNSLGLPAVAIDLGLVNDIGVATENKNAAKHARADNLTELSSSECIGIIEFAMANPFRPDNLGSVISDLGLSGSSGNSIAAPILQAARFALVRRRALAAQSPDSQVGSVLTRELLKGATSLDDAVGYVEKAVLAKISNLLMTQDELSPSASMSDHGVDSLIAVVSKYML
jgi:NAD(P)-dependent dehydrogenase (short-subunit alcohol dehydrogenase family)